jgi:isocitrate/isopropylmalate dehydrogenase
MKRARSSGHWAAVGEPWRRNQPVRAGPRFRADIAGKDIANPIGAIASAAMLLRHALSLNDEASTVERAIARTLSGGRGTRDVFPANPVGTREMAASIAAGI